MLRVPTQELVVAHDDLIPYLNRPIDDDLRWLYEYMKAPVVGPYAHILDVLSSAALKSLQELPVSVNGKCPTETLLAHAVGGPLVKTMGRISLMNRYNPTDPDNIVASLKDETGTDISLAPHKDFLDGHAVLFNYGVVGKPQYIIDGKVVELSENEIVVLNGSYEQVDVSDLALDPTVQYGNATPTHAVVGEGFTSRKRLLVYADGMPTTNCQITA